MSGCHTIVGWTIVNRSSFNPEAEQGGKCLIVCSLQFLDLRAIRISGLDTGLVQGAAMVVPHFQERTQVRPGAVVPITIIAGDLIEVEQFYLRNRSVILDLRYLWAMLAAVRKQKEP